jgi:excisionase family DNA binding protein
MAAMPTPSYVSTAQVPEALGVSVSTVKRWVEDGILPARKTARGHRKLLLADVLEVARSKDFPVRDLSLLMATGGTKRPLAPATLTDRLHRSLLSGSAADVGTTLFGSYRAGVAIETLADDVVAPAMARICHQWKLNQIDVLHEHRATQLCSSALYELKGTLQSRAGKNCPLAVGAAPERDTYSLPTLLAEMTLVDAGWNAVNLGPNTPLASLTRAVK